MNIIRMCHNCKYFALNGGFCLVKAFNDHLNQICDHHEFTRGALEKQARLKRQEEASQPGFIYADTDSVKNVKG